VLEFHELNIKGLDTMCPTISKLPRSRSGEFFRSHEVEVDQIELVNVTTRSYIVEDVDETIREITGLTIYSSNIEVSFFASDNQKEMIIFTTKGRDMSIR
jgi:hypothetical protein